MACPTLSNNALTNLWIRPKKARSINAQQAETASSRAAYFEQLIQCFGQGYPPSIKMPSVLALAALYQCDALSVLGSLRQLHRHAYNYRLNSLDLPLVLLDPLCRFRCKKSVLRLKKQYTFNQQTPEG